MPLKFAIMGLRHGHVMDLVKRVRERDDTELVGVCEEHRETREAVAAELECPVFDSYQKMLATLECNVIGVGDFFGKRGSVIIEALKHAKHVISDKPVCTRIEELDEIESLLARSNRTLGCQLDMRGNGQFIRLRRLVREGDIGEVHAISFNGQHPLMYGKRPAWYFEDGKQGGTINDIAIHAFDYVPWITGVQFQTINAARTWNAGFPEEPQFLNAAQMMLTLENGCGVLGDVSYLVPTSFGYTLPHYWRTTLWGSKGVAETHVNTDAVTLYRENESEPRTLPADPPQSGRYLQNFLDEINGDVKDGELCAADILRASRISLKTQSNAERGNRNAE